MREPEPLKGESGGGGGCGSATQLKFKFFFTSEITNTECTPVKEAAIATAVTRRPLLGTVTYS